MTTYALMYMKCHLTVNSSYLPLLNVSQFEVYCLIILLIVLLFCVVLSHVTKKHAFNMIFAKAKTKARISCMVTPQLISAFVFAALIIQSLTS